MQTFEYSEEYPIASGNYIYIDIIRNTGTQVIDGQSQSTHTIRVRYGSVDSSYDGYTDANVFSSALGAILQNAKNDIDASDEFSKKAIDLGFVLLPGILAPTNFMVTAKDDSSITLDWDLVTGADYYVVDMSLQSDFSFIYKTTSPTNDNPYTFTGLAPNTRYYMRVTAVSNTDGYSDYAFTDDFTDP